MSAFLRLALLETCRSRRTSMRWLCSRMVLCACFSRRDDFHRKCFQSAADVFPDPCQLLGFFARKVQGSAEQTAKPRPLPGAEQAQNAKPDIERAPRQRRKRQRLKPRKRKPHSHVRFRRASQTFPHAPENNKNRVAYGISGDAAC